MSELGRRERNKVEKLTRILDSARAVFAEKGEAAATTAEIADRADVSHATLFLKRGEEAKM